jgi:hypothetical protein
VIIETLPLSINWRGSDSLQMPNILYASKQKHWIPLRHVDKVPSHASKKTKQFPHFYSDTAFTVRMVSL